MSPTLSPSRFLGSFALMVSVPPWGPLTVTVWFFRSMAVIVTVAVTSRPTAPAGVSPGLELTRVSWVVTPGAAPEPAFMTRHATASMYAATTGSPTLIWSSFDLSLTSIVMVRLGPLSVTVPASLSMASTVPRTFVTDASPLPRTGGFSAGAGAFPAGGLVLVDWANAGDWVKNMGRAIKTAVIVVLM